MSDIEDLHAFFVHYKCIAELDDHTLRTLELRLADDGLNFRFQRIVEIDDNQSFIAKNVCVGSGDGDAARAAENAVGIESQSAFDEVVAGIAIEQRADAGKVLALDVERWIADNDEAVVLVGPVEESVHQVNGLLFVFRIMDAERIYSKSSGGSNIGCVFAFDVELLAER